MSANAVAGGVRWLRGAARGLACVALLGVLVAAPRPARADAVDEAWKRGNDSYLAQKYADAAAAYEQIDRQGVASSDLYLNLGDAYFRLGRLGPAIWAFERAAALEPDDDDARFNLAQARKLAERRARDRIEGADREPLWIRAVTALTSSTETWLFVALYLGAFAALFLRRRARGTGRVALGAMAAILGAVAFGAGALLGGRVVLDRIPYAVVLPDAVDVKDGADTNYRTSFELHAGARVRLVERDQDWVRIRLANGLDGWVRERDVGRL